MMAQENNNLQKYPLAFHKIFPDACLTADLKLEPEDFQVSEVLGFEPSGEGEHLFLQIRKNNLTTEALVKDVAKALSVAVRDVGYCGLKDKMAITDQWLSVTWPIKEPIPSLLGASWQVITAVRHNKKLKRGIHQANNFVIRLKNITGDLLQLEENLQTVKQEGFPNYFGDQRFGRSGANVEKAERIFKREFKCKPFQRSLYYSAARSYLFNHYLSIRVEQRSWNKAIAGDSFNLAGSNALFGPEVEIDEKLQERINVHDIHPVGPLFGEGESRLTAAAFDIEQKVAQVYPVLVKGLQKAGIKIAYRPLRVIPKSLNWHLKKDVCELHFSLPSGSYATALIDQLIKTE